MNGLTFVAHAIEPILIGEVRSGDPNSARGLDFIPGSVVRGALIGRYLGGRARDAGDPQFRSLFFDDRARFLNAYPMLANQRSLPVPLSWHRDKDQPERDIIFDLAAGEPEASGVRMPGRVSESFCWVPPLDSEEAEYHGPTEARSVVLYRTGRQIAVHTHRADRMRLAKGTSTVFRYEAIAPGEAFGGAILGDDPDILGQLATLIQGAEFSIGKSQTAGYGRVSIDGVQVVHDWREYRGGEDTETLTLTFLSDALVRNPSSGGYGVSLADIVGEQDARRFVATRLVGGFNRTWGLPLPQAMAIRAGSVYVYRSNKGLMDKLRALERDGVGERRAEGFGRIAVNWHQEEPLRPAPVPAAEPATIALHELESKALAQRMVARMWRSELDAALVARINTLSVDHPPSNAQLSRMRAAAREALRLGETRPILAYLGNVKSPARDQIAKARVGATPLPDWMGSLAANPERVWAELGVGGRKRPSIGGLAAADTPELALEYAGRLIDGALHKAAKEQRA